LHFTPPLCIFKNEPSFQFSSQFRSFLTTNGFSIGMNPQFLIQGPICFLSSLQVESPLGNSLPTFTFAILFLPKNKLVARKSRLWRDCAQKASAGKEIQSKILLGFRKMRRAHRAPSRAPLHRDTPVLRERRACPPGPRNDACLMVFPRNALAFGPGNA
jgi:hypothetical protein